MKQLGEKETVIAPDEAAKALLSRFRADAKASDINIFSVQMCYAYYNTNYTLLTPTWVFTASCERNPSTESDQNLTYYLYYAVNALTGEVVVYDIRM